MIYSAVFHIHFCIYTHRATKSFSSLTLSKLFTREFAKIFIRLFKGRAFEVYGRN